MDWSVFNAEINASLQNYKKKAYWSFCVVKSLKTPINTYLCSIYY